MKDALNRIIGVVDETSTVIAASDLNMLGEVRSAFTMERAAASDGFVSEGYT